jgi:FKBP-type peptidyl-prolyl cis-trans isomerase 2
MPTKKTAVKQEEISVKKGDKIKVDYEGSLEDGTIFDSSTHGDHSHPLEFEAGAGKLIKGFDNAILGMKKGEEKNITIPPAEAYGDIDPTRILKVPKDKLPSGQEPKAGMMLLLKTPDGNQFPAMIKEITDNEATIDLNHPLAGKILKFNIKIIDIQSA